MLDRAGLSGLWITQCREAVRGGGGWTVILAQKETREELDAATGPCLMAQVCHKVGRWRRNDGAGQKLGCRAGQMMWLMTCSNSSWSRFTLAQQLMCVLCENL
jgi:hypothetical protein